MSNFRKQRIMLLARLNLGLASEDKKEIDLYNNYQNQLRTRTDQDEKKIDI